MSLKAVRKAILDLDLEQVFSLDDLLSAVGSRYGKPIFLEALPEAAWGTLTAFLEEGPDYVTVFYRVQDSPQYRLQCVCHELGHLVMDTDCSQMIDVDLAAKITTYPDTIRLQARDLQNSDAEIEVEEFAYSIVQRLRFRERPRSRAGQVLA